MNVCGTVVDGHNYECWGIGCPTCDYPIAHYELSNNALRALYSLVEPKSHWKDPIDASVPVAAVAAIVGTKLPLKRALADAVVFFTATKPVVTFEVDGASFHVTAPGYRAGPAGDH